MRGKWFSRRKTRIALITYTFVIVLLSILPINSSGSVINHTYIVKIRMDYLLHLLIFFGWMLWLWMNTAVNYRNNFRQVILLVAIGFLFAFAIEAVQWFLPYRAFNINDLMANEIGISLGALLFIK